MENDVIAVKEEPEKHKLINEYEMNLLTDSSIIETLNKNILKRNKKLNQLIKLINTIKNNKIIAIDGEWGSGKTVFVKQLELLSRKPEELNLEDFDKEELKKFKNNHFVYYYNAWENDFHNFPILSIIYKIINDFPMEQGQVLRSNKAIPVFLNNIIATLTKGIVDINAEMDLDSLVEEIKTSEEIKACLNGIIDNLLAEQKNKMIVIIDELDRCNPNFAVKTLEAIKQFYSNDKVIFIVATNNEQLSNTVCKHYGEKFDSHTYLNKFYDLVIPLEISEMDKYIQVYLNLKNDSKYINLIPIYLIERNKMSYRQANKYVSSLRMLDGFFEQTNSNYACYSFVKYFVVPYALALKEIGIKKYNDFIKGKSGTEFVNTFIDDEKMKQYVIRHLPQDVDTKQKDPKEVMIEIYNILTNTKLDYYDQKYDIGKEMKEELQEVLSMIRYIL